MVSANVLKTLAAAAFTALSLIGAACSGDGGSGATPTSAPATAGQSAQPVTLHGRLTLDGAPVKTQFLGVRVVRPDGLAAACQRTIPTVTAGEYEIGVLDDAEMRGCGAPGGQIVLWVHVNDTFHFSRETLPWPGGGSATFDATFSSADPAGATRPETGFKGHLFAHDGTPLPSGTVIEAYVGDVRCGLASLRAGDEIERFYTLSVAGPESVPGCAKDAALTFRLDGKPAAETATNDLGSGSAGHELDLTLKE